MNMEVVRVLCIDPHPFVGDWLARRLRDVGLELAAIAPRADDAVDLVDAHDAAIVVMEASAPGVDPISAAGDLARRRPHVRTMFLSAMSRARLVWAALEAGASGFFAKGDDPERIVSGVRSAARDLYAFGGSVLALCPELQRLDGRPRHGARLPEIERPAGLGELTLREHEVLRLLAQGLQRSDIASCIHRSPKTVDKHRAAVMRKLDIHDRAKLVLFAVREGLVPV